MSDVQTTGETVTIGAFVSISNSLTAKILLMFPSQSVTVIVQLLYISSDNGP